MRHNLHLVQGVMVVAFAAIGRKAVARATAARMLVKRVIVLFLCEGRDENGDRQSVAVVSFDKVGIDFDRPFCIFDSF